MRQTLWMNRRGSKQFVSMQVVMVVSAAVHSGWWNVSLLCETGLQSQWNLWLCCWGDEDSRGDKQISGSSSLSGCHWDESLHDSSSRPIRAKHHKESLCLSRQSLVRLIKTGSSPPSNTTVKHSALLSGCPPPLMHWWRDADTDYVHSQNDTWVDTYRITCDKNVLIMNHMHFPPLFDELLPYIIPS